MILYVHHVKESKMKHILSLVLITLSTLVSAQNEVCFSVESNPFADDDALQYFSKYIDVYGCGIFGESGVSDENLLHVAAVWAELIDNNEDGAVDDPELLQTLLDSEALMPVFEFDESQTMDDFFDAYDGDGIAAILWQSEIDPSQPGHWGDDATVEEVLHTINAVGHRQLYPDAFEIAPNSSLLTAAMDIARGGQWLTIPDPYPEEAWYHYDDWTCDYECMAVEYLYWCIVSHMGILDDVQTCNGIDNEWELCTPELFMEIDTSMYNLITDAQYLIPQLAPDGNYCPSVGVDDLGLIGQIYPNPSTGVVNLEFSVIPSMPVVIIDSIGREVYSLNATSNRITVDLGQEKRGHYIVRCGPHILGNFVLVR